MQLFLVKNIFRYHILKSKILVTLLFLLSVTRVESSEFSCQKLIKPFLNRAAIKIEGGTKVMQDESIEVINNVNSLFENTNIELRQELIFNLSKTNGHASADPKTNVVKFPYNYIVSGENGEYLVPWKLSKYILEHELSHKYFSQNLRYKGEYLYEFIQKRVEIFNRYKNDIKEITDLDLRIKYQKEIGPVIAELSKANSSPIRAIDELFADIIPVLLHDDPMAIAKAINFPKDWDGQLERSFLRIMDNEVISKDNIDNLSEYTSLDVARKYIWDSYLSTDKVKRSKKIFVAQLFRAFQDYLDHALISNFSIEDANNFLIVCLIKNIDL